MKNLQKYTCIPDDTPGQLLENAVELVEYLKLVLTGQWTPIYVSAVFLSLCGFDESREG